MFSFTTEAVLRDGIAILACILFMVFSLLIYCGLIWFFSKKKLPQQSYIAVCRDIVRRPGVRLGASAFFLFLVTYACKLVLIRMIFALIYALVIVRICLRSEKK